MIIVTGAYGFIASNLISALNRSGYDQIIAVDDFSKKEKEPNLELCKLIHRVERSDLFEWLDNHKPKISFVFHLGARTDTTETDRNIFQELNLSYSKKIWNFCSRSNIPLVYASSAATYGNTSDFSDDHKRIGELIPLNEYAKSKHEFDLWVLKQKLSPSKWFGLKFFNVYGPREDHKGRMASVVWHIYQKLKIADEIDLFRSHRDDVEDGMQSRDFIHVQDVCDLCMYLLETKNEIGQILNLGTGTSRSFLDLANITIRNTKPKAGINFIDTPVNIRKNYQYYSKADTSKLRQLGFKQEFRSLEEGIADYVNYMNSQNS